MKTAVGVDIGGTKVACCLVDPEGNDLCAVEMASLPEDGEKMFRRVVDAIGKVWPRSEDGMPPPVGIGVGVPGKVDRDKGVAVVQNNLPWRDFPLAARLRDHFPADVLLDNDVCMAAYGEWMIRGGSRQETFVYFTISTGIACCTIHQGHLLRGTGFAGEIGLVPFSPEHRLEEVAAGPAIADDYRSPREVIDAYRRGEAKAGRRMESVMDAWARGLYGVISLLDPHQLVLGGSVIQHNPFLLAEIRRRIGSLALPIQQEALERLSLSRSGSKAGCIGAGLRVFNRHPVGKGKGGERWMRNR